MSKPLMALALWAAGAWHGARALDLQSAVDAAASRDPALLAGEHALNASRESRTQAVAAMLPTVNLVGAPSRLHGEVAFFGDAPVGRAYPSQSWAAKLSQPLLHAEHWVGVSRAGTAIAQTELKHDMARRDTVVNTVQAYFDVLMAYDDMLVAQDQCALSKEKLSVAEGGLRLGSVTLSERADAQLALTRNMMQRDRAGAVLEDKRARLESMVQSPVERIAKLDLERDVNALAPVESMAPEAPAGVAPEVRIKQLGLALARHDVRLQRAANLPTVDLTVSKGRYTEGGNIDLPLSASTSSRSTVIGLQINVPIVNGGASMSRMRQSAELALQADAELDVATIEARRARQSSVSGLRLELQLLTQIRAALALADAVWRNERDALRLGRKIDADVMAAQFAVRALHRDLNRSYYTAALHAIKLRSQDGAADLDLIATVTRWIGHNGGVYPCAFEG